MPVNKGNQDVTLLYYTQANSREVNKRFQDIRQLGIYKGGRLSVIDTSNAQLSPLVCEISDGTYQVKVETTTAVNFAVVEATPYVVLRWNYTGSTSDYMEILIVATPASNDLVIGKCSFGAGNLIGFDYGDTSYPRSTPNTQNLFLKVEPTENTELRVRIRVGRVQNGKETIVVSDQKSNLFTPPGSNKRIDLVYVDRSTGTISIDNSGTVAASPVPPNYGGKLILAEVTLTAGNTNVTSSMIRDVRDFVNISYDVDGVTIEVNSNGKLAVKSNVKGQSQQVVGTTNIYASSGWQDMDSMTINMTTTDGNVLLLFSGNIFASGNDNAAAEVRFTLDGSPLQHRMKTEAGDGAQQNDFAMQWLVTPLAAGSHIFRVQWIGTQNPAAVHQDGATYPRVFIAQELPH